MDAAQEFTEVVCGLLVRREHILVALRYPGGELGDVWEFPGGKVEAGENHVAALVRESVEELGVDVEVGPLAWDLVWPRAGKLPLRLWFYFTKLKNTSQEPQALAAQKVRWVRIHDLPRLPFCQGDGPMIAALVNGDVPFPA